MERDNGLCQPCLQSNRITAAVAVDHIIPKAQGGTDADTNLQAICKTCHDAKTADESRRSR
ncbi:HNH endonuclease [Pontibacter sp. JAM-7]|uniref:HNH endonuclease n=1 Tax=Pontibacter sp. JAM-7 TaxID=3366581 RepID=UPI003AF4ACC5